MKRIGLALGGGGVRGVAHIAYIKAMEDCHIRPCVISGTSSGAIVGAMYAGGMNPDEMYAVLERLFSVKQNTISAFKQISRMQGNLLSSIAKKYLHRILPKNKFEELEIPLKVVATNFHSLEERVFSGGDILSTVMGSIALPGVFNPQPIEEEYYIDGGATNIVPFDIIREECDVLVAIDVSKARPNSYKVTKKNASKATWAATQEALISIKLKSYLVEIFERPDFGEVSTMEFSKYKRVYKQAEEMMPDFINKLKKYI